MCPTRPYPLVGSWRLVLRVGGATLLVREQRAQVPVCFFRVPDRALEGIPQLAHDALSLIPPGDSRVKQLEPLPRVGQVEGQLLRVFGHRETPWLRGRGPRASLGPQEKVRRSPYLRAGAARSL